MKNSQKGSSKLVPIIVIVAVLIAGGGYYMYSRETPAATNSGTQTDTPVTTTANSNSAQTNAAFKDGSYSAEASYYTPESKEIISVTLTLKNGIVTESSLIQNPREQKSVLYQEVFAAGYKKFVIGKKISEINVGVVSGSSLTGKGFNDALAKIKAQAQV